jgi:WD40 repeat protein
MRRFRYSIAGLLGLVLFVAVAFAALRQADELWDSALFSLTVGLLLTSVLLTIHRTGRKRAFWLGFALLGWTYLIASLIPPVESRLLTTTGLAHLDSIIPGRDPAVRWLSRNRNPVVGYAFSADGQTLATNGPGTVRLWDFSTGTLLASPSATSDDFVRIGHSLLALALAFVGGQLSRGLFDTQRAPRADEPGGSTAPVPEGEGA